MLEEAMPTTSIASVTRADVRNLLGARGVDAKQVEFLREIGPNGIEFTGYDEPGYQVVRGVVALKARLVEGRLVAYADVELLPDGEIPF